MPSRPRSQHYTRGQHWLIHHRSEPAHEQRRSTMATRFTFSLDGFRIATTMAAHTDSDHIFLTVKVGSKLLGPLRAQTGDVNDGVTFLSLRTPASIDDDDSVLMTYQIINNGHAGQQQQLENEIRTAEGIAKIVGEVGSSAFPPAAVAAAEIEAGILAIGDALSFLSGVVDCDGLVLSDTIVATASDLASLTESTGSHTETRSYTGPDTPSGCGANARYDVTWTISRWSGWTEVGGGGATRLELAATSFHNRLFLFGVSTQGQEFVNSSADCAMWTGWSQMGGGGTTNLPLAATVFHDRIFVFGISTQGREFVNSSADGTTWTGWTEIGGGGTTNLPLTATVFRDRIYIFGVSGDRREFVNSSPDGAMWTGWKEVGGGGNTNLSLTATVFRDRIYIFGVSKEGREFANSSPDGATWTGWVEVGGGGTTNLPLAATVFRNRLFLFGVSTNGREFVNSSGDGTHWSGWHEVGGGGTTNLSMAAAALGSRLCLAGVSREGREFINTLV
jgi:hypothetical protein